MSGYTFPVARFNWLPQRSAWQDLQIRRARMAALNAQFDNNTTVANSSFFGALTNQISGSATNAAQAALARIQAASKVAAAAKTKQIDQAQSLLSQTQANPGTGSTGSSTGTVLNSAA